MLDSFLNTCIAYRILLTIPVTVAFVERRFSKLKLIKSYLRSTMSQKKFSRLAILSIEERDVRRTWIQIFNWSICILKGKKIDFKRNILNKY